MLSNDLVWYSIICVIFISQVQYYIFSCDNPNKYIVVIHHRHEVLVGGFFKKFFHWNLYVDSVVISFSFNVRNRNILQLVDVRKIVVLKVPKQVPFSNCSYVFPSLSKRGMAEYPWNSIFSTTCLSVSSLNICDTFLSVSKKIKCSLITSCKLRAIQAYPPVNAIRETLTFSFFLKFFYAVNSTKKIPNYP